MSKQPDLSNLTDSQRELISIFPTLPDAHQEVILAVVGILVENAESPGALPFDIVESADPALGLSFVSDGVLYLNVAACLKAVG